MSRKTLLSKSKIKQSSQCELALFYELNYPEYKQYTKETIESFEQGREVESLARSLFPKGIEVKAFDVKKKLSLTEAAFEKTNVVFEATFVGHDTTVQFDILKKVKDKHQAIEVKSGTSLKPDYIDDVMIQYFVATKAGIKISKYEVWYVNKEATGDDDFFVKQNVLKDILKLEYAFSEKLAAAKKVAKRKKDDAPVVKIGSHCSNPYDCPFKAQCWGKSQHDPQSVLNLPHFPKKYEAFEKGIISVCDERFDKEYKYDHPQVLKAMREEVLVKDEELVRKILESYVFPLHFLDFETVMTAIPLFPNTKPYEQVVVQFSSHMQLNPSDFSASSLSHFEFLFDDKKYNPMLVIDNLLLALDNDDGTIVSYNKSFEASRLKELAKIAEDLGEKEKSVKLFKIVDRLVDLMEPIKKGVYHPFFKGSYSLKAISPVLLGEEKGGYTDSEIKSGAEIAKYYVEFLTTEDPNRKEHLRLALLKYCKYDTLNLWQVRQWGLNLPHDLD